MFPKVGNLLFVIKYKYLYILFKTIIMSSKEYMHQYYLGHYYKDKITRSKKLIKSYMREDKNFNRGECTLTPEQLIELWENGCYWCGEKDWLKLGADRIDNTKPHTIENCVCSCLHCNCAHSGRKKVLQFDLNGNYIAEYNSLTEAAKETGSNFKIISQCCLEKRKTHNGFIWKYK